MNDMFVMFAQIVEQQQRDDEELVLSQTVKTVKGRAKPRKQVLSEVAPSAMASRVVPQVDQGILARAKAANALKKKKALVCTSLDILKRDNLTFSSICSDDYLSFIKLDNAQSCHLYIAVSRPDNLKFITINTSEF